MRAAEQCGTKADLTVPLYRVDANIASDYRVTQELAVLLVLVRVACKFLQAAYNTLILAKWPRSDSLLLKSRLRTRFRSLRLSLNTDATCRQRLYEVTTVCKR